MATLSEARGLAKQVYSEFSEKNVTFMAAGLAYNAFVSLAPILILLFLVISTAGGRLEERVMAAASTWLPGPIADVVRQLFQGEPSTGGASVVGLVVLVWGALKIFRGLDTAFSEIYETVDDNSFVDKMKDGVVVLVALVVAVVATVGVSALFAMFSDVVPFVGLLTPLVLVAGLVLAFYPMYYVFPDVDVDTTEILPGVVFAAVGWAVFQGLFQVYLQFSDPGSGSFFGGVIVVVTYLYFSALVLLVGAVVNAVVGDHSSGKPGGVGQGATPHETERDDSLNRDELAAYLRDLREELTGHYEEMRPRTGGPDGHPRPAGDVKLTEHSTVDEDTSQWTVTLQWEVDDEPGVEGASESPSKEEASERRGGEGPPRSPDGRPAADD